MKSFSATVRELWELLKAYALKELYEPLKALRWYLLIGVGGAACTALGVGLIVLGVLRATQVEAHRVFDGSGDSSAIPYFIVAFVCVALMAVLGSRINRQFEDRS